MRGGRVMRARADSVGMSVRVRVCVGVSELECMCARWLLRAGLRVRARERALHCVAQRSCAVSSGSDGRVESVRECH